MYPSPELAGLKERHFFLIQLSGQYSNFHFVIHKLGYDLVFWRSRQRYVCLLVQVFENGHLFFHDRKQCLVYRALKLTAHNGLAFLLWLWAVTDRKSTRLNSSH